jgi:Zn-dependent protease with chaperone function
MSQQPASSSPGKIIAFVVFLPLACALAGGWQFHRAYDPALSDDLASYREAVEKVQAIRAADGPAARIRTGGGKTYAADTLLRELNEDAAYVEKLLVYEKSKLALSAVAVCLGALGALIGAWGLLAIRSLGKRALVSRDALLTGFQAGLKKIPWLIGGVGFLAAGALAFAVACEVLNLAVSGVSGRGAGKLVILGITAVIVLLVYAFRLVWKMFTASRAALERETMRLMGKSVSEREAPKVWAFVRSVAAKAGAAMPDGIVLGLDEGFFVTEHPVELRSGAPVPQGRILYLPLPYMAFMGRDEAAAVIGHELGHFTGADTEYSLRFSPIYAGAVNHLRAVAGAAADDGGIMAYVAKPSFMLGELYLDSFDRAVQHWSRRREFAADGVGAAVASSEAVALSLLRISVLAPLVRQALAECWQQGGQREGGVLARVRDLVRTHGLGDPREHLEEAQSHPTDSHPAMRRRLEAVGVDVTPALLERARDTEDSGLLRELGLEGDGRREEGTSAAMTAAASGMAPGAPLSSALEEEFSRVARDNADSVTASLKALAAQGREERAFYEGGILMFAIWGLIALLAFAASAFLTEHAYVRYGALTAGVGLSAFMLYRYRLRAKPFATFTMNGLRLPGQEELVPWTAVDDYSIMVHSTNGLTTNVEIILNMHEGYELPAAGPDRRVRFSRKKRRIAITVLNLRDRMNADTFSELLGIYWRGGLARAQLYAMRYGRG